MSITILLNVLLGLFLTWSLLSLASMQIQEWIAARLKWRSRMLEKTLGKMLTDFTLEDQFYNHPLIRSLYTGMDNCDKPSYIPAGQFSQAMIDILSSTGTEASLIQLQLYKLYSETQRLPKKNRIEARRRISLMLGMIRKALVSETGEEACAEILDTVKNDLLTMGQDIPRLQGSVDSLFDAIRVQKQQINDALVKLSFKASPSEDETINRIRAGVTALSITHPQLKQTLYAIMNTMPQSIVQKENELEFVRSNIEEWFNNAMNRLTGWYKRRCLITTLLVGILLATIVNVDSINLISRLWREPDLRIAILSNIENILTQNNTTTLDIGQLSTIQQQFSEINLPVGWLGSPVSPTSNQVTNFSEVCTLFPQQENETYGILISGECYPIINSPKLTDLTGWLIKFIGILISGIAASPGSSFWFDLLKKIINVRLTGVNPSELNTSAA
jgi:predicted DNA-binding transcriptional regulator AlpA